LAKQTANVGWPTKQPGNVPGWGSWVWEILPAKFRRDARVL